MTKKILVLLGLLLLAACSQPVKGESQRVVNVFPSVTPITPGVRFAYKHDHAATVTPVATGTPRPTYDGVLDVHWKDIEATQGVYSWSVIDNYLAQVPTGRKTILRVLWRNRDIVSGGKVIDGAAPAWALKYNPIEQAVPKSCYDDYPGVTAQAVNDGKHYRINYLDPTVRKAMTNFIAEMGKQYNGNSKIEAVEFSNGFYNESTPWAPTSVECDKSEQELAYTSEKYPYTSTNWGDFFIELIDAYASAFPNKTKIAYLSGALLDPVRWKVVQRAAQKGVGIGITSLGADFYSNRDTSVCQWPLTLAPGTNYSTASSAAPAYRVQWAPLPDNYESMPIFAEWNNWYDPTGRMDQNAWVWWGTYNALDKHVDVMEVFENDIPYREAMIKFNEYAGMTATTTPRVWSFFRSSNPSNVGTAYWCPDWFNYQFFMPDELEKIAARGWDQGVQNDISRFNSLSAAWNVGPSTDWRSKYSRYVSTLWPALALDVDDAYRNGSTGNSAKVVVTYLDSGTDQWGFVYDSTNGVTAPTLTRKQNTGQWIEKTFDLTDARFANNVPGNIDTSGYDIKLASNGDGNDYFSNVVVTIAGRPIATPTQAPFGVSTPTPTAVPTSQVGPTLTPSVTPGFFIPTVPAAAPTSTPTRTATPTVTPTRTPTPTYTYTPTPTRTPTPLWKTVLLNEIVPGNEDTNRNGVNDGLYDQCIEIYNASGGSVNLDNWTLRNNGTIFTTIQRRTIANGTHYATYGFDWMNGWRLQPGTLELYDSDGNVRDTYTLAANQLLGKTVNRDTDGGAWTSADYPTCGLPNKLPTPAGFTPKPTWTPTGQVATPTPIPGSTATPTLTATRTPTRTTTPLPTITPTPTPYPNATATRTPTAVPTTSYSAWDVSVGATGYQTHPDLTWNDSEPSVAVVYQRAATSGELDQYSFAGFNQDIELKMFNRYGSLLRTATIANRGQYGSTGRYDNETYPSIAYNGTGSYYGIAWMTYPDTVLSVASETNTVEFRTSTGNDVAYKTYTIGGGLGSGTMDVAAISPTSAEYAWSNQQEPSVAAVPSSNYNVVVWQDHRSRDAAIPGSSLARSKEIWLALYNGSSQLRIVNATGVIGGHQEKPDIACQDTYCYLVYMSEQNGTSVNPTGFREIYGVRYNVNTGVFDTPVKIANATNGTDRTVGPRVSVYNTTQWVVTWARATGSSYAVEYAVLPANPTATPTTYRLASNMSLDPLPDVSCSGSICLILYRSGSSALRKHVGNPSLTMQDSAVASGASYTYPRVTAGQVSATQRVFYMAYVASGQVRLASYPYDIP